MANIRRLFNLFNMSKSRSSKEQSVSLVTEMIKSAKGIVLADFTGLTVKEMQELRTQLGAKGIEYEVVKKTLFQRSLVKAGVSDIAPTILKNISVSLAVSPQDEIEPAKVLVSFAKSHNKLKIWGGFLAKHFIPAAQVQELSCLPSQPELLGRVVGVLYAPLAGLVNVMRGNLSGLVRVLRAAAEKKA